MIRFLIFSVIGCGAGFGQEVNGTSTVTLGVGGAWSMASEGGSGPTFNGTYEYRLKKYLELEFGFDTAVVPVNNVSFFSIPANGQLSSSPTVVYQYGYVFSAAHQASVNMPFGFRLVRPMWGGRLETFAGGGGDHGWGPYLNGWGPQAVLGARVAADKQRHFWLGATGRYLHVLGGPQLVTWTADVGFRFGR